jgi:hypothetical protein
MKISEIATALTLHYRKHKAENNGHKTSPSGKYGFKSLQYRVAEPGGTIHGPFLGRGAALTAFRNNVKMKGHPTVGVQFLVDNIFKPKAKGQEPKVDNTTIFEVK